MFFGSNRSFFFAMRTIFLVVLGMRLFSFAHVKRCLRFGFAKVYPGFGS